MKKQWEKKEIKDAKKYGGRRTPRSGGIWFIPGDVTTKDFLIENKTSKHERFGITAIIWKKIRNEALKNGRMPCLSIQFGEEQLELVILDKADFDTFFVEK